MRNLSRNDIDNRLKALKKRILTAKGESPADLVLKGGKVVNLFSGEISEKDVAVFDGVIVGTGVWPPGRPPADVSGK